MRAFTVKVSKCGECKNKSYSFSLDGYLCNVNSSFEDSFLKRQNRVYEENKDGLTPSCPMWSEAVEAAE